MTPTLRHAAGSLFVVGVSGHELTAPTSGLDRAWLKLIRPSGIILFKRNIADPAQTRALLHEAISFCAPNSLRCVDVEGGTVDRLRDALAPMPSAQAVAQKAAQLCKPSLARQHGELIARSIKAFGFNTTLAPVLDLALPASFKVMGTRAAAATPEGVTQYAKEFLSGLKSQNIAGCAKHFPGLGAGSLDSHAATPSIPRTFDELWRDDLLPYRELRNTLPMVMVNHAAYPSTRSGSTPASVSQFWITTILRQRIAYRGLIFSDDLEMGGILHHTPIDEAAIAAIRAGTDLIEICHSPELILRAYESLVTEAESSSAFRKILLTRSLESVRKRKKLFGDRILPPLSTAQFAALRDRILRFRDIIGEAPNASSSSPSLVDQAGAQTA